MEQRISVKKTITAYRDGQFQDAEDDIVSEVPLTIFVNKEEFATMVCSPQHYQEMVVGFLASEGVILFINEISTIEIDEDKGFAYVELNKKLTKDQSFYSKRVINSCCGKSRQFYFQNDAVISKTSMSTASLTAEQCIHLMKQMQQNSQVFKKTGGVHNAAICTPDHIIIDRADIGRHNALDKLYGYCLVHNIAIKDKILVFSGRLSSEVLTKASKIGVGLVLSKSAPTDLAIKLAEDLNITAVGFIRGSSFNVYSHKFRIKKMKKEKCPMSSCSIDHTKESVIEKLKSQKPFLPSSVYQSCNTLLADHPSQSTLNELFHLLKKYDLKDEAERLERDEKMKALAE